MPSLAELTRQLVDHLAPVLNDDQKVYAAEYVQKELSSDTKGSTRREWVDVLTKLNAAERAARVRVQENLADGLNECVRGLVGMREKATGWEDDLPLQISNLPQHIQLLLNLSSPPSATTHQFAYDYLHRQPNSGMSEDEKLYREIMDAEPFAGDHWGKGYDEEVTRGWTDSESESNDGVATDSSVDDEEIVTPSIERLALTRREEARREVEKRVKEGERRLESAKNALDTLERAYWRTRGESLPPMSQDLFGWKELLTRCNAASLAASIENGSEIKTITALQLQREILFALTGRPGIVFAFEDGVCSLIPGHAQIRQMSNVASSGVLGDLAHRATQLSSIKRFVKTQTAPAALSSARRARSKTQEAFAEACRAFVESVDNWISNVETASVRGSAADDSIPSTPLSLLTELDRTFGDRLDGIVSLIPLSDDPIVLLNSIHSMYTSFANSAYRQHSLDLFLRTARPVWTILGRWIVDGMPVPRSLSADEVTGQIDLDAEEGTIDPEIWIKRDRDVSWTDEDFWETGYVVGEGGWPGWMGDTRDMVLEAGKARGLLRGMMDGDQNVERWDELRSIIDRDAEQRGKDSRAGDWVNLGRLVEDHIAPICQITIFQLRRVLEEDCGLEQHLDAVEGIMYLKGHLSMAHWLDTLHTRMRKGYRWNDMQSLTSGLRDAIEETGGKWLNPAAVRLSPGRDISRRAITEPRDILRTLGALRVTYNVPYPLSILFTSTSLDLRAGVFGFLVQLDHAKRKLAESNGGRVGRTDHPLDLVAHRLWWFIETLWTWITERVISVQTGLFRAKLAQTSSLKDMIGLELEHTRLIRDFAFLHDHTADLNQHIMAVLEIAVELPKRVSGDTALRASRHVDESEDEAEATLGEKESTRGTVDPVPSDLDVLSLQGDLEARVQAIRKAVERLAFDGGMSEEDVERRSVWAMLSFALDDWR